MSELKEISVDDLNQKFENRESFVLLDVREQDEYDISRIDGCVFIPMSQIESRLSELDKEKQHVVYCRRGGRSAQVCVYMQANGFKDVINVAGGMIDWAAKIEPGTPVG